jgi:hypothetical protein
MLFAILQAVARAMRRSLGSFAALKVNNFFLFVLLLIDCNLVAGLPPRSAYPFLLLVGFLLLGPMSSDPLAKIPPARLAIWPLAASQRLTLRMTSLAISPVFWVALVLLLFTARSLALAFLALAVTMQAAIMAAGSPQWRGGLRLRVPGKTGPLKLIAAAIRQIGRHASLGRRSLQYRWRFTGGRVIVGVPQAALGLGLGLAAQGVSLAFFGVAAVAYCVSLGISSRKLDTQ